MMLSIKEVVEQELSRVGLPDPGEKIADIVQAVADDLDCPALGKVIGWVVGKPYTFKRVAEAIYAKLENQHLGE